MFVRARPRAEAAQHGGSQLSLAAASLAALVISNVPNSESISAGPQVRIDKATSQAKLCRNTGRSSNSRRHIAGKRSAECRAAASALIDEADAVLEDNLHLHRLGIRRNIFHAALGRREAPVGRLGCLSRNMYAGIDSLCSQEGSQKWYLLMIRAIRLHTQTHTNTGQRVGDDVERIQGSGCARGSDSLSHDSHSRVWKGKRRWASRHGASSNLPALIMGPRKWGHSTAQKARGALEVGAKTFRTLESSSPTAGSTCAVRGVGAGGGEADGCGASCSFSFGCTQAGVNACKETARVICYCAWPGTLHLSPHRANALAPCLASRADASPRGEEDPTP